MKCEMPARHGVQWVGARCQELCPGSGLASPSLLEVSWSNPGNDTLKTATLQNPFEQGQTSGGISRRTESELPESWRLAVLDGVVPGSGDGAATACSKKYSTKRQSRSISGGTEPLSITQRSTCIIALNAPTQLSPRM